MRDWATDSVEELAELPSGNKLTGPIFALLR